MYNLNVSWEVQKLQWTVTVTYTWRKRAILKVKLELFRNEFAQIRSEEKQKGKRNDFKYDFRLLSSLIERKKK